MKIVFPGATKAALVAIAVLASGAMACSSGDDETAPQPEAPASAPTAAAADTPTAAATDAASGSDEDYQLAQQFELSIELTSTEFNERKRIPKEVWLRTGGRVAANSVDGRARRHGVAGAPGR